MASRSRRDFVFGLGVLVVGCGGPACRVRPEPARAGCPSIKRRTLSGESVDTKALAGRVVVVKFFAEYCAPCKKTLPAAQALAHPDVAFIGVSEDEHASTAAELSRATRFLFR
jgi:thiol-disulfide isomerase/thioredoxin